MTWKEKIEEFGGSDATFLTEDGETITFVICADPVLFISKYKGQENNRIGFPIVSMEGFSILVIGKRVVRRLGKHEKEFETTAFEVTRNGEPNSQDTTYDVRACKDPELTARLFELKAVEYVSKELPDAIKAVEEILKA